MSLLVKIIIVLIALLFLTLIILSYKKSKQRLRFFITTLLSGNLSLLLVNISGLATGIFLPISFLSVGVTTLIGVPGVVTMLLVKLFWKF